MTEGTTQQNPLARAIRYFQEAKEELKKVTWPSKETAIRYSAYVIGISVAVAALIGVLDWIFTLGLEKFIAWLQ